MPKNPESTKEFPSPPKSEHFLIGSSRECAIILRVSHEGPCQMASHSVPRLQQRSMSVSDRRTDGRRDNSIYRKSQLGGGVAFSDAA